MRFLASIVLLLSVLAFPALLHATTYDFSGTILTENKDMENTGTITGSVNINTANPLLTTGETANFTATYDVVDPAPDAADYSFTFTGTTTSATKQGSGTATDPFYYVLVFSTTNQSAMTFDLDFTDVNGVITVCQINTNGYSGNGACDQGNVNQGGTGEETFLDSNSLPGSPGDADLVTGSLVAATPEPSSLALMGTGMLGAYGVVRRRFARS
jgi:PEP-CTERM motif